MRKRRGKSANGRVIARRLLTQMGPEIRQVTVSIGAPRQRSRDHWECLYSIQGIGNSRVQRAGGVDALQALLLAVEEARIALDKTGSRFSWLDIDPDKAGSGIPRYIPIQFGPQYEARINIAIERENKRYFEGKLKNP